MSAENDIRKDLSSSTRFASVGTHVVDRFPRPISSLLAIDSGVEIPHHNPAEWKLTHEGMGDNELWRVRFALGNGILTIKPTVDGSSPVAYVRGLFELKPQRFENLENTTPAGLNIPDFFGFNISSGDGTRIDQSTVSRLFDMRHATLQTSYTTVDHDGNSTDVACTQLLSQSDPHQAIARYEITPRFTGKLVIDTGIDGNVDNGKVRGTNTPNDGKKVEVHKYEKTKKLIDQNAVQYVAETKYKNHRIAVAKKTVLLDSDGVEVYSPVTIFNDKKISQRHEVKVVEGQKIIVDTFVSVRTDVDQEILEGATYDPESASRDEIATMDSFEDTVRKHKEAWEEIWGKVELDIQGDDNIARNMRFNKAHILTEVRPGYEWAGIGAKKAPNPQEGYKNHAFWDGEMFNMNGLTPEQALTMLSYRHRLLPAARYKAIEHGAEEGAFWPWEAQFANDDPENGEACPAWVLNELGIRVPIEAKDEEIHISADIAYATMEYFWMSNDWAFLRTKGAEMILESARFYKSRAVRNESEDRFEFHGVTGPDEYHMGVNNDAYTNIMAKWTVLQAIKLARDGQVDPEVKNRLGLSDVEFNAEIAELTAFADKIYIPFDPTTKIFNKFDGWEDVQPIDLESKEYKGIVGMDEKLRTERLVGKKPEDLTERDIFAVRYTNVIKQHDVLMALAMLGDGIIDVMPGSAKLDKKTAPDIFAANYDIYNKLVCNGSSLAPNKGVELSLIAGENPDAAYAFFEESAAIDYGKDTHHTKEGIHTAAIGGAEQAVVSGFAGIKATADALLINPRLPSHWRSFGRNMYYKGYPIRIEIDQIEGKVFINLLDTSSKADFVIRVNGDDIQFKPEDDGSMLLSLRDKADTRSPDPQIVFTAPKSM